MAWG
jgi:hypothetical protein